MITMRYYGDMIINYSYATDKCIFFSLLTCIFLSNHSPPHPTQVLTMIHKVLSLFLSISHIIHVFLSLSGRSPPCTRPYSNCSQHLCVMRRHAASHIKSNMQKISTTTPYMNKHIQWHEAKRDFFFKHITSIFFKCSTTRKKRFYLRKCRKHVKKKSISEQPTKFEDIPACPASMRNCHTEQE